MFIWQFYTNQSFDKESSLALLDLCHKWKSILKLCSSSAPLHHWCPVKYLSAWKWKHICPGSTFHIFHAFTPPGKSSSPFLELRHVGLERDGIDRLEEPHQLLPQHPALLLSSAKAVHRGVERHHIGSLWKKQPQITCFCSSCKLSWAFPNLDIIFIDNQNYFWMPIPSNPTYSTTVQRSSEMVSY